jgi:uncharacterized OB-fold protein
VRTCKRCGEQVELSRTLCPTCRGTVVLRDLPGEAVVRRGLAHFGGEVKYTDGALTATVEFPSGLRLLFEVLEDPERICFGGHRWVDFIAVVA